MHQLKGTKNVIDIRTIGLIAGIELAPRDGAPGRRALETHIKCFETGTLVRFTGDIIAMSPPLIVEKPQIDRLVENLRDAITRVA